MRGKKRLRRAVAFLLMAVMASAVGSRIKIEARAENKAAAMGGMAGMMGAGIGDLLVGPGSGGDTGMAEGGQMEPGGFYEAVGTADLDALCAFIQTKETAWREQQSLKMEKAGIPADSQSFLYEEDFKDMSKEILAMTAVCRDYTFYNRIVCQWYADNLWEETYPYEVIGTKYQEKALKQLQSLAGGTVDFLGMGGASLMKAVEHTENVFDGRCKVAVILKNRPRTEIYDMDYYQFRIPVEWEGWTEEKRQECDALIAMEDEAFREEIEKRQAESLLYSPLPFYKQGAAEWGAEAFGGGTLASDACCPTAIAMVLSYFKGERITPLEVSNRYDNDAYRSREQGSYGGKMCAAAGADYGLRVQAETAPLSGREILDALEDGAKIVMSMKPGGDGGRYATVYHYVTLAGLTEDGKVIVNNPGINTDVTYDDIETIINNQSGRGYGIFRGRQ
ncbi:MAG: hypothetical protein HFI68_11920 [Lachnospiraceae bacterium]|nr:hypothetical protein [Lachnospiraceae bacterium]